MIGMKREKIKRNFPDSGFGHAVIPDEGFLCEETGIKELDSFPRSAIDYEVFTVLQPHDLYSFSAILVRMSDHRILMEKRSDEEVYPASLTKMMTVIIAIESLCDLQEKVELPVSIFHKLYGENASMAGFKPYERVKLIDLLYGAMLPSGAECCLGLVERIADSEENFVKFMNEKALELDMNDTHFENVTGLHDRNHYSTVKDLSFLLNYALKNVLFRKIFTAPRYTVQGTNKHPSGMILHSTLFKNLKNPDIENGKILGGKTGYTDEAGLCLASLATKDEDEYIMISVGANGNHKTEQYNISDALMVYNNIGKNKIHIRNI